MCFCFDAICECAVVSLWVWLSSDFHLWQSEKAKKERIIVIPFLLLRFLAVFFKRWMDIGHRTSATVCHYSMLGATCELCYMWRMTLWRCGNFCFFSVRFECFFLCELNSHFVIKCVCVCMHSVPFVIVVGRRDFCRWFQYCCYCCCCYFSRRSSFIVCGHCQKRKMSIREMYKQWKMTQTNCTATHIKS